MFSLFERRRSAVSNLDLRRFAASVSGRHSAWEDVSRRFIEHGFLLLSAWPARIGLVSGLKSGRLFRLSGLLLGSPSSVLFFVVPTMITPVLVSRFSAITGLLLLRTWSSFGKAVLVVVYAMS
ncbi:hypothetical protein Bca4012_003327 [Brassica carinata]